MRYFIFLLSMLLLYKDLIGTKMQQVSCMLMSFQYTFEYPFLALTLNSINALKENDIVPI